MNLFGSRAAVPLPVSLKPFPQAGDFLPQGADFLPPRLSAGLQLHLLLDQRFPLSLHHGDLMAQVVVDLHEARLLLLELADARHYGVSSRSLARISSLCLSTTSFSFFITCRSLSVLLAHGVLVGHVGEQALVLLLQLGDLGEQVLSLSSPHVLHQLQLLQHITTTSPRGAWWSMVEHGGAWWSMVEHDGA
ncbi:hypothetical protein EYF80_050281 [Liparis tanakae]|uniref:Uncharacterized protein n=1 Tax=Liparis tanakae TaxID=230148 RepID=A0A4Z2FF94_9TELE|nr:hypothetical protein EYF80_050281 [Liparis tanakae]